MFGGSTIQFSALRARTRRRILGRTGYRGYQRPMLTLIDTSVLAALHRGLVAFDAIKFGDDEIAVASVTASDLLRGVYRTADPERRARREAFVERLLDVGPG